ncbi:MAG: zf-HC2 domain-containing protein [Bacteroidota bacterium]
MTCEKARSLVFLDRAGERTPSEDEALSHHLAICPRCREERIEAGELQEIIDRVRQNAPEFSPAGNLTAFIMEAVGKERHRRTPWRERLGVALSVRFTRVGIAAVVGVLIAAFSIQSTLDAKKIAALELRLGRTPPVRLDATLMDLEQLLRLAPEEVRSRIEERLKGREIGELFPGVDLQTLLSYAGSLPGSFHSPFSLRVFPLQQIMPDRGEKEKGRKGEGGKGRRGELGSGRSKEEENHRELLTGIGTLETTHHEE